jgi:NAD(P)-dependent dehydrogenase (short-subunit alcohol dehydrogenase family)
MDKFSSSDFVKSFEVNTFGIAYALEVLIPIMKKQGYGTIAGVTSLADIRGYGGSSSYSASKAAGSILLESARVELKKYNIRVITVRPGFVKTAMTDKNEFKMPLLMQPPKASRIIRKKIENGRSVVQFPWPIVLSTRIIKNIPNWIYDWGMNAYRPAKKK